MGCNVDNARMDCVKLGSIDAKEGTGDWGRFTSESHKNQKRYATCCLHTSPIFHITAIAKRYNVIAIAIVVD